MSPTDPSLPTGKRPLRLEIAGVRFLTRARDCRLRAEDELHRLAFRKPTENLAPAPAIEATIGVARGEMPPLDGMREIFSGTRSWRMLTDGSRHAIEMRPDGFETAFWVAVAAADFRRVDIHCGREFDRGGNGSDLADPLHYPLDQILTMHLLATRGGLLVHAAGVELAGKAWIFAGRSGAGKSEISRQLAAAGIAGMLSDDRMILRRHRTGYRAFGTPWPGDAGVASNRGARLGGIFFLHHGRRDRLLPLPPARALERLLPVTSVPWYHRQHLEPVLTTLGDLVARVPAAAFHFQPHPGLLDALRDFISDGRPRP